MIEMIETANNSADEEPNAEAVDDPAKRLYQAYATTYHAAVILKGKIASAASANGRAAGDHSGPAPATTRGAQ